VAQSTAVPKCGAAKKECIMQVPPVDHPCWEQLVSGKKKVSLGFLATKMMLVRLQMGVVRGEVKVPNAVRELRELFQQNIDHTKVQDDLQRLMG
jgi:hypothetical protein